MLEERNDLYPNRESSSITHLLFVVIVVPALFFAGFYYSQHIAVPGIYDNVYLQLNETANVDVAHVDGTNFDAAGINREIIKQMEINAYNKTYHKAMSMVNDSIQNEINQLRTVILMNKATFESYDVTIESYKKIIRGVESKLKK